MRHPVDPSVLGGSAGDAACAEVGTTAEQVTRFLRNNPDFLLVQPDLLQDLAAPLRWTGDKIVDYDVNVALSMHKTIDRDMIEIAKAISI